MKNVRNALLIAGLCLGTLSTHIVAQEHHYWTNQYGSRSALMSGAVVAGVRDTSAGFYNPGALGFLNASTFSASGNGYQVERVDVTDAGGTALDADSMSTNIIPLLISGTFALGDSTVGYSLLTRSSSSISLSGQISEASIAGVDSNPDIIFDQFTGAPVTGGVFDGPEVYRGQFTYDSSISEIWGGLSWAQQLDKDISLGVTGFIAMRSRQSNFLQVGRMANIATDYIASEDLYLYNDYYNVRALLKFGIAADYDDLKLGATLTTPSVSLFGSGTVAISGGLFKEDDAIGYIADDRQEALDAEFRTPMSLALGLEYAASSSTRLAANIEWFAEQKRYAVMTPASRNVFVSGGTFVFDSQDAIKMENSAESVLNYAVAVEHAMSERTKVYLGLRTDFSTFSGYDNADMVAEGINNWDLYHLTFGMTLQSKSSEVAVGLTYSTGKQDNHRILADINPADRSADDFILAINSESIDGRSSADYSAIGVIIGYTYYLK